MIILNIYKERQKSIKKIQTQFTKVLCNTLIFLKIRHHHWQIGKIIRNKIVQFKAIEIKNR